MEEGGPAALDLQLPANADQGGKVIAMAVRHLWERGEERGHRES